MSSHDEISLRLMMDAALEVLEVTAGHSRHDLESKRCLVTMMLHDLRLMGDAAVRVSPATQALYADVPWESLVAMRNRLIRTYFDVDLDLLWNTVTNRLPTLVAELQTVLHGSVA